jgi:hypothetical protein
MTLRWAARLSLVAGFFLLELGLIVRAEDMLQSQRASWLIFSSLIANYLVIKAVTLLR